MKKKILSLILATLMIIGSLPLSVLADGIVQISEAISEESADGSEDAEVLPVITVTSPYYYSYWKPDRKPDDFRVLPDDAGNFVLNIALDKNPTVDEEILVYYRTVDDSAVCHWGDYEGVMGAENAHVTLNSENGYQARITIKSKVMEQGYFVKDAYYDTLEYDRIITRRFLFQLTRVEGNALLPDDEPNKTDVNKRNEYYCYLRAKRYLQQDENQGGPTPTFNRGMQLKNTISTPYIEKTGSYTDSLNIDFDSVWRDYTETGTANLYIALNGKCTEKYWQSDGLVTFHLYYVYQGVQRCALSLYIEGEFDDSKYFGWQMAFDYVNEDYRSEDVYGGDIDDFMEDNFVGFTLYNNDGSVAHEVKMGKDRSDEDILEVCKQLKALMQTDLVSYGNTNRYNGVVRSYLYHLKLPSNFALADSYSYVFMSETDDTDYKRRLEKVYVDLWMADDADPVILEDERGVQMVTTNLEEMQAGDPLKVMIRFDRPVKYDYYDGLRPPNLTLKINGEYTVELGIKHITGKRYAATIPCGDSSYSWDTLVFEGELPEEVKNLKITRITDIQLCNPNSIQSHVSLRNLHSSKIYDLYGLECDMRPAAATISATGTGDWTKSKSMDLYVNLASNVNARFNDYATVYYQWSNSKDFPESYSSKLTFHTSKTGEFMHTITGSGNGEMYLHVKTVTRYGQTTYSDMITGTYDPNDEDAVYTPLGPFCFDNLPPEFTSDDVQIEGDLKKTTLTITLPDDEKRSGSQYLNLYYVKEGSDKGTLLKSFDFTSIPTGTKTIDYTINYYDVGVVYDGSSNREKIDFYWITSDKLGNTSEPCAEFSLIFDLNDYLYSELVAAGPQDFSTETDQGQFVSSSEIITDDNLTYIYDYKKSEGKLPVTSDGKTIYYGFSFAIDHTSFGEEDNGEYSIRLKYNGESITDFTFEKISEEDGVGLYVLWIHEKIESGRYTIQLVRSETNISTETDSSTESESESESTSESLSESTSESGEVSESEINIEAQSETATDTTTENESESESTSDEVSKSERVSQIYTVYTTYGNEDDTPAKAQVDRGTLLSNSVYQLSTLYPYFYYKDKDGIRNHEYYNDERRPATFSSYTKAKEYVYFKELSDIYLFEIESATLAAALNTGTGGFVKADGETMMAAAGQYWIRYKSALWTPTSDDTYWVYYYYGTSANLNEGALSANLLNALNTVSTRITNYGKSADNNHGDNVILTDSSLFLGSAMGTSMLDKYGMPYLLDGQIHADNEIAVQTKCGNVWSIQPTFSADKNIYKSVIYVGDESGVSYGEYPIIGNFKLSETSIYQYQSYNDFLNNTAGEWTDMSLNKDQTFFEYFTSTGIYYIREICDAGVSVYPIYVDKSAPKVTFSHTDENGRLVEMPVDGDRVVNIATKDMIIGSIKDDEYDRLSYVAVYKISNLSMVGVYTADDLERSTVQLQDGNYYIVVADRSGNHYTITAKVSSSDLSCQIKESKDNFIKISCNRRNDQIVRYEVYLDGELLTSTYTAEQSFDRAGVYTVYIHDVFGNNYSTEYEFRRSYPTVTWKYFGEDGKYHEYDAKTESTDGFALTWVSDNKYKISTSVKTRFSFSGNYEFEFLGDSTPEYTKTIGAETVVTISEGSSFTLKVYYKNYPETYVTYSGVVDVTPPTLDVSASIDTPRNNEYNSFDQWAKDGKAGDVLALKDLCFTVPSKEEVVLANGDTVSSDFIKVNAYDINDMSYIEVYLDDTLCQRQDMNTGFSQIILSRWGSYKIVAQDGLGNIAEMTFTNGEPDKFDYFIDGNEQIIDYHGYMNFQMVDGKYEYTVKERGNSSFRVNVKEDANVFMSVGLSDGEEKIIGFKISGGCVYPLTYQIVLDKDNVKTVQLVTGDPIIDTSSESFKHKTEYLLSDACSPEIYASVDDKNIVSISVYPPKDTTKVGYVSARLEFDDSTMCVSAEISQKSSTVSFKDLEGNAITGTTSSTDIKANDGFVIDESAFSSELVTGVKLYYSNLNDLDPEALEDRDDIYAPGESYNDDGFYMLVAENLFGNKTVYRIGISKSFAITSSVTFGDSHKIYYSKVYGEKLYSNNEITLDILDEGVVYEVKKDGVEYTGFGEKREHGIVYLIFSQEGVYDVRLTDSYGNVIERQLEINKSGYSISDGLLTGFNENALRLEEGYTNQKISVDKSTFVRDEIYYLAIKQGETLDVIYDAFSEGATEVSDERLINAVGNNGDGVYTVICRNRYGAVVTKDIHYRETPTLKLERTTRSHSAIEAYDLNYAIKVGFWSNNTLVFSTDATNYVFTVNGSATECPRTLAFENAGDFGGSEYNITYIDEYGFEYNFKAYLVRQEVSVEVPAELQGIEIDGVLNTKNNVSITFGENIYATYTLNNGEEVSYKSGEVLKKDGIYRFTVVDYAGNATIKTIKKDTIVEFSFVESSSGVEVQNGGVVNSSKVRFNAINKDSACIAKVVKNGVTITDFTSTDFTDDGKWEVFLTDKLGNEEYFCFYIVTREQNGFAYTTPYEYRISEMWYDGGDGIRVSYMNFVNHSEHTSSFDFKENGKYTVVMTSDVTGATATFEFTINTSAPEVFLVGCNPGETTINDVTISGCRVGDTIKIYKITDTGEELVEEIAVTSMSTKMPTIAEGGEYRIVVESEAGVSTELTFIRKHVMNTAGSVFIMIVIGCVVVGLFAGLIYRNKSKTDE